MDIMTIIEHYFDTLLMMLAEMSPYLLLGFLIAGLLRFFVPQNLFHNHLAPRNMKSVTKAVALGIPLPLCSCGVIPTSVSLRKHGASHGACMSFLIATPQTGIESITASYSMMGLPFTIIRPIAALITALFGGWMVNRFGKEENIRINHHHTHEGREGNECHPLNCEYEHKHEESSDKCCHNHSDGLPTGTFLQRLKNALSYSFVDMLQDVGKWLVFGLLLAALITVAVPNEWLATLHDYKLLNMLIALLMAMPMYICATGSIPIAVSLMAKGLTPGAALVLLLAGPAVNSASMLVVGHSFGKRTLGLYLLSIIIGAIVFGLCIDYFLPQDWFTISSAIVDNHHHHHLGFWDWTFIVVFLALLVNAYSHRHKCTHHH